MADRSLKLFFDEAGTQEITQNVPDFIKDAVLDGTDLVDEKEIYLKSVDNALTYEEIFLTTIGDEDDATESGEVDITYSLDGTTFKQILEIPDGAYDTALKIYRKAVAPSVTKAFKRPYIDPDTQQEVGKIEHNIEFHEYVK